MLTLKLFEALEKKGIIVKDETEVDARFESHSPFGDVIATKDVFLINDYTKKDGKVFFKVTRLFDAKPAVVSSDDVFMIDCMDPVRLAEAYDIDENGDPTILFIEKETDARTQIVGQVSVEIDGHRLKNGNRIVLINDKNRDMKNVVFTVKGCGEKIELSKPRGRPKKVNSLDDID